MISDFADLVESTRSGLVDTLLPFCLVFKLRVVYHKSLLGRVQKYRREHVIKPDPSLLYTNFGRQGSPLRSKQRVWRTIILMTKHHNVLRKEQPVPHSLRESTRHPRIEWGSGREPQRTSSNDRAYHEDEVPLLSSQEPRGLKSSLRKLNPHHRRLKSVRFWSSSGEAAVGKEADATSVDTQWPSSRNANVLQRDRDRALQASAEAALEPVSSSASSQTSAIPYVPMQPYVSVWAPQGGDDQHQPAPLPTPSVIREEPVQPHPAQGWNHVLPASDNMDISLTLRFAATELVRNNHAVYHL